MKRITRIAVDLLLGCFAVIAFLTVMAELDRREQQELRDMERGRSAQAQIARWSDLDAAARAMTAFDKIGKK